MALRVAILGGDRARRLRRALPPALVAADPLGLEVRERRAEQPDPHASRSRPQRGPILDRIGRTLVTNVAATAVEVWPADLPKQGRYAEMKRLVDGAARPARPSCSRKLEQRKDDPLTPVTMQVAVHDDAGRLPRASTSREFPGVQITHHLPAEVQLARRCSRTCSATSARSPAQLADPEAVRSCELPRAGRRTSVPGDRVGQTGVEQTLRHVPARPLGRRSSTRQLARRERSGTRRWSRAQPQAGLARPADDRHLAPARGRAGAPVRHPPRPRRTATGSRTAARSSR